MAMKLGDFVREARAQIKEWDAETAAEKIEDGGVLVVDVREADEYAKSHLPGAICIPRGVLEGAADPNYKHRDERLCNAHDRTILLVCESGGRSAMAAVTLQRMGFEHVYNLAGGVVVWEAEDLPMEQD
jgi:rhodanese-related sulfurtransferase